MNLQIRFRRLVAATASSLTFILVASSANGSCEPPAAPQDLLQLRKIPTPPTFVANDGYDPEWVARVREGIDAARQYLGNYGPTHVYIVGQLGEELENMESGAAFVETMCRRRHPDDRRARQDCRERGEVEQLAKARDPKTTEAYLSGITHVEVPFAELFFINPHNFGKGEVQSRAIHEYTHVRQMALPAMPNWLMEGAAEILAWHLGELKGWSNLEKFMSHGLDMIDQVEGEYTIRDFELQEPNRPGAKKYIRHFAYDAGAWAVLYLIHSSPERSIRDFHDRFYPRVGEVGWQKSLCEYGGFEGMNDFYERFEAFLDQPRSKKMLIVSEIRK